jgi:hypothetical protein
MLELNGNAAPVDTQRGPVMLSIVGRQCRSGGDLRKPPAEASAIKRLFWRGCARKHRAGAEHYKLEDIVSWAEKRGSIVGSGCDAHDEWL